MADCVYLSLGSNLGNRQNQLHSAIAHLNRAGRVTSVSSFYETEPVEITDQPWFLNCVLALETNESPEQLLGTILKIECEMGRERTRNKGPRTIDIDILLFGDRIIDLPTLTIPHPAMHQRRFVLDPLAEIAPQAWHPLLKKSVRELLAGLPGSQIVRKIPSPGNEKGTTINDGTTAR
jgi:2-amino-4-hydroxy-6-hydroxymethyldihydropteridine diphosphokinase